MKRITSRDCHSEADDDDGGGGDGDKVNLGEHTLGPGLGRQAEGDREEVVGKHSIC